MRVKSLESRYMSIDIMRIICAVLVIYIHTNPLIKINKNINFIISNGVARLAVPLFFVTSGYLFYSKYNNNYYLKNFLKKITNVYLIWSIFYVSWAIYILVKNKSFTMLNFVILVKRILFCGTNTVLWYFPAIIYSIIICSIFIKKKKINLLIGLSCIFYIFASLGDSYFGIIKGSNIIKLINLYNILFDNTRNGILIGVTFLTIGIIISKYEINEKIKRYRYIIIPLVLLLIIELVFLRKNGVAKDYNTLYSVLFLTPMVFCTILNKRINIKWVTSSKLRDISLYMYCSHGLFMIFYRIVFIKLSIDKVQLLNVLNFFLVVLSSLFLSILIVKLKNSLCNKEKKYEKL